MPWVRRIEGWAVAMGCLMMHVGCASGPLGTLRFENRDPIWHVNDRQPIPKPRTTQQLQRAEKLHDLMRRPVLHALSVPEGRRARNVNTLGEVPDSTWFTNRIGVRAMTPEQVALGPGDGHGPDRSEPWRIVRGKTTGVAPGFLIEDARGVRYLLKFDPPSQPEVETGAEVVAQRLLWAAGYHVPDNEVVQFDFEQLVLAADAHTKNRMGERVPLTAGQIQRLLADVGCGPHDRCRALASRLIEGEPLGGAAQSGSRLDDPNDRVPHELRRELRGKKTLFAWLKQTDAKPGNTLDVWIESEPKRGLGYVKHYLLDFGKALGARGAPGIAPEDGWAYWFDYSYAAGSLWTFGLWERPWEGVRAPNIRGVGRYTIQHYEADGYRSIRPYAPFLHADRFDAYWASKILLRFRREHIAAAVRQADYSDPRAYRYLVRALVQRKRKTAAHWLSKVNPVDYYRVERKSEGWRLCGRDLAIAHGLAQGSQKTRYELRAYDYEGRATGWKRQVSATPRGFVCAAGLRAGQGHEGYTMVVVRTRRPSAPLPRVIVHLARRGGDGPLRVLGIDRR